MTTKTNLSTKFNDPEFVAWVTKPQQLEKYQAISREKFDELYAQAKVHAKRIAQAVGIETESIDSDTSDVRLQSMIDEGEVYELNGLYWKHEALDDATQEFYKLD